MDSRLQNISGNSGRFASHFQALGSHSGLYIEDVEKTSLLLRWLLTPLVVMALIWARDSAAQATPASEVANSSDAQQTVPDQVRQFVLGKLAPDAAAPGQPRVEVLLGQLDARLRLAPCERIQTYLPTGVRLWGKTRVGLRCVKGATPWNVYLPVTVNVYGRALVAAGEFPAGHVLANADFREAEVNVAEELSNPIVTDVQVLIGRTLAKPVSPGQTLRQASLKARQWFAAGEQIQIRAVGNGFAVASGGEALTAGLEGQVARVRTESGRVISGIPVADKQLEIAL